MLGDWGVCMCWGIGVCVCVLWGAVRCFPSGATVLPTFNVAQMSQTQHRGAVVENRLFFPPSLLLLLTLVLLSIP